jgi:hypothetical protein
VKWTRSCLQRHAKSGRRKEAHNDNLYLLVVFHLNCCIINNYDTQLGVLPRLLHFSTEEPNFSFFLTTGKSSHLYEIYKISYQLIRKKKG